MLSDATRKRDFPDLDGITYLNTAAEGLPPRCVLAALAQYGHDKLRGMDGRQLHEAQWEAAKAQTARALGLTSEEVGICSCSSEAYNLAALALQLRAGDQVVITDMDFPAGVTPWLLPTCPAEVRLWRSRAGGLRVEDLIPLLGPRTRLVSVSLVSFFNGFMISLPAVVEAVRKHSPALFAVDVTQALGRIPLDLSGVDLVVSSTHKWILASHGGGLVGVPAARARQWTVPAGGWFNRPDPFGDDRFEQARTRPGAASFMVGMPNYPAIYAIGAALGYIQSVGVRAIDDYARPLVMACLSGLRQLSIDLLTPDEPDALAGILAFRHPDADRINRALHEQDIHIMNHAGRLRIAIHGYNTMSDIERLLKALRDLLGREQ